MVSVVIPTHNRCDTLERAILSVLAQSYHDFEIIVVSDGSTDNTKNLVDELSTKDNRITFVEYFPAKGGNHARNVGIHSSKGEFVAFLDDDDEWYPDKLASQLAVMNSSDKIGLVYTGVCSIFINEGIKYNITKKKSGDLSKDILISNYIGTTSTVMAKKKLLDSVGGFDENLKAAQDYDLWIRISQICEVGVVPEIKINYYNYSGNNQISSVTQKYIEADAYINRKYKHLFEGLSEKEKKERKINTYHAFTNRAMRNGDRKQARKYARMALKERVTARNVAYLICSFVPYKTVLYFRRYLN